MFLVECEFHFLTEMAKAVLNISDAHRYRWNTNIEFSSTFRSLHSCHAHTNRNHTPISPPTDLSCGGERFTPLELPSTLPPT